MLSKNWSKDLQHLKPKQVRITWTVRSSIPNGNWFHVCWSPQLGMFAAVAYTGTNRIMTSTDGVSWTVRTAPAGGMFLGHLN